MQTDDRPRGTALPVALALPAFCVLLVPLAAWLDARAPDAGIGVEVAGGDGWPWALNGALLGLLAAVVLTRSERPRFGWALAGFGLFWGLDGLAQSYVHAGLTASSAWPGMTFALWFLDRFGAYLTVVTATLLLIFPTGRFLPGRWRFWSWAMTVLMLAAGGLFLVIPTDARDPGRALPPGVDRDPMSVPALAGATDTLVSVALASGLAGLVFALLTVVVRYRRAEGEERDTMRWLAWSAVVLAVVLVLSTVIRLPMGDYLTLLLVTVLPPAAMTVGMVRPTLVPIQDLLGRTVVLAVVLAVLLAADAAVIALLSVLLDDALTQAQTAAVVLLLAVALYGPLRARLSATVRRRMLGERSNRYDAVAGLASTLETTDDSAEQLAAVAEAVAAAFAIAFVSVEVDRDHGERLVTTIGHRPDHVRTLPITYRDATIGRLVLPARGLRSRLDARDQALLGDLVRQAATAARAAQLAAEVQRSREHLVAAREEERRRIRRDLHDGLGPALGGVVFQLETARMAVSSDPVGAREQLATIRAHVQDVVADVRRLVHDLRPPALDDRGLVGALRQQAETLAVPLEVRAGAGVDALPAAAEVAAYRIVGEALANIARHAGATRARLSLEVADDDLVLEVADDGIGVPDGRTAGVGLTSIRERAAELGGTTTITSRPGGGTVVRARLPLRSEV